MVTGLMLVVMEVMVYNQVLQVQLIILQGVVVEEAVQGYLQLQVVWVVVVQVELTTEVQVVMQRSLVVVVGVVQLTQE